eukprot:4392992-Pyramimonas_sp.AAC.1
MQRWLGQGHGERAIRHGYSLHQVARDDRGKIIRASRGRGTLSAPALEKRDARRAITKGREEHRGQVCGCERFAANRLECPMGRPSRSPNLGDSVDLAPWGLPGAQDRFDPQSS